MSSHPTAAISIADGEITIDAELLAPKLGLSAVMAHESFENPDVARLMNERFVNIKVDRQELQDFPVEDHLTGSLAEPKATILTYLFSCWQVSGLLHRGSSRR